MNTKKNNKKILKNNNIEIGKKTKSQPDSTNFSAQETGSSHSIMESPTVIKDTLNTLSDRKIILITKFVGLETTLKLLNVNRKIRTIIKRYSDIVSLYVRIKNYWHIRVLHLNAFNFCRIEYLITSIYENISHLSLPEIKDFFQVFVCSYEVNKHLTLSEADLVSDKSIFCLESILTSKKCNLETVTIYFSQKLKSSYFLPCLEAISKKSSLIKLELYDFPWAELDMDGFFNFLSNSTTLKDLVFTSYSHHYSYYRVDYESRNMKGISNFIENNKSVENFTLNSNRRYMNTKELLQSFGKNKTVRHLKIGEAENFEFFNENTSIHTLEFLQPVNTNTMKFLANFLSKNSPNLKLQNLLFSYSIITSNSKAFEYLGQILLKNTFIQSLQISHCNFEDPSKTLGILLSAIKKNTGLKLLNLCNNRISNKSVIFVLEALGSNQTIETLDFRQNYFGMDDDTLTVVFEFLDKIENIKTLHISSSPQMAERINQYFLLRAAKKSK